MSSSHRPNYTVQASGRTGLGCGRAGGSSRGAWEVSTLHAQLPHTGCLSWRGCKLYAASCGLRVMPFTSTLVSGTAPGCADAHTQAVRINN